MMSTNPAQLAFFKTSKKEQSCLLSWAAAHHNNSSYFDIQRSTDGITFMDLGRIYSTNEEITTLCYHFADQQPSGGINNYRLKLVDKLGNFSYSAVRSLSFKEQPLPV